jgi:hypothetical protein
MFLRPATHDDEGELRGFECARPERPFELEVEHFVRDALTWIDDHEGEERELLVLEDDGEIVGVVMHEDDDGDRFVNALAIRTDRQTQGLGRLVLNTVLDDLSQRYPGRAATWLVAPANFASHALSQATGAEALYPPETKPYALYVIAL